MNAAGAVAVGVLVVLLWVVLVARIPSWFRELDAQDEFDR